MSRKKTVLDKFSRQVSEAAQERHDDSWSELLRGFDTPLNRRTRRKLAKRAGNMSMSTGANLIKRPPLNLGIKQFKKMARAGKKKGAMGVINEWKDNAYKSLEEMQLRAAKERMEEDNTVGAPARGSLLDALKKTAKFGKA